MAAERRLTPEMKFLMALYSGEVFEGRTVRQEKPRCCGTEINLFAAEVAFKEITVGKKVYHLIEPICPSCGKRINAIYSLLT